MVVVLGQHKDRVEHQTLEHSTATHRHSKQACLGTAPQVAFQQQHSSTNSVWVWCVSLVTLVDKNKQNTVVRLTINLKLETENKQGLEKKWFYSEVNS